MGMNRKVAAREGRILPRLSQIRQMQMSKRAGVIVFLLFALIVIGLHPLTPIGPRMLTGGGDTSRQAAYILVFVMALFSLRVTDDLRYVQPFPFFLAALIGWCWLSVAWSIVPDIAVRRLALTTMLAWLIFLSTEKAGFEMTVKAMRLVLLIKLVLNYEVVMAGLSSAIHRAPDPLDPSLVGDWRGIMAQKNIAGGICAVTVIMLLFFKEGMAFRWRLLVSVAATYFLYRTVSKTSMGAMAIAILCGWIYSSVRPRWRPLLIPPVAAVGALFLYVINAYITATYHSPDALTGRVQIWPVLFAYSREHFWLGSGFGSFWNVGHASPVYSYSSTWVSTVGNGHNGYLDLLISLGFPGLVLALLALVLWPVWNLLSNTRIPVRHGAFLVASMVFCCGHQFTESSVLDRDTFVGIVLLFNVALVAQVVRESSVAASRGAASPRMQAFAGPLRHDTPLY